MTGGGLGEDISGVDISKDGPGEHRMAWQRPGHVESANSENENGNRAKNIEDGKAAKPAKTSKGWAAKGGSDIERVAWYLMRKWT